MKFTCDASTSPATSCSRAVSQVRTVFIAHGSNAQRMPHNAGHHIGHGSATVQNTYMHVLAACACAVRPARAPVADPPCAESRQVASKAPSCVTARAAYIHSTGTHSPGSGWRGGLQVVAGCCYSSAAAATFQPLGVQAGTSSPCAPLQHLLTATSCTTWCAQRCNGNHTTTTTVSMTPGGGSGSMVPQRSQRAADSSVNVNAADPHPPSHGGGLQMQSE
jgi:hypothetical protein